MGNANYGLAGGTTPAAPATFLTKQRFTAIERIDTQLSALLAEDPTAYYSGDFDALLDRRSEIKRQFAEGNNS